MNKAILFTVLYSVFICTAYATTLTDMTGTLFTDTGAENALMTQYGTFNGGNGPCGFGSIGGEAWTPAGAAVESGETGMYTVAIGPSANDFVLKCGMCAEMTVKGDFGSGSTNCPTSIPWNKPLLIFAANLCPECDSFKVDLAIAPTGQCAIDWKAVPCPTSGNIQLSVKENNIYDQQILLRNHKFPVQSMEVNLPSGWKTMTRDNAQNRFRDGSWFGLLPLEARITSIFGEVQPFTIVQQMYDRAPAFIDIGVQFSTGPGGSTTAPSTDAPTETPTAATQTPTTVAAPVMPTTASPPTEAVTMAPSVCENTGRLVYEDSFQNGFSEQSWDSVATQVISPVRCGLRSLKVSFQEAWAGAKFVCKDNAQCIPSTSTIYFWLRSSKTVTIQMGAYISNIDTVADGAKAPTPTFIPADTWTEVSVSVQDLSGGEVGDARGIMVQLATDDLADLFFDQLRLLSESQLPTVSPNSAFMSSSGVLNFTIYLLMAALLVFIM